MKFDVHKFSGSPAAHQLEKWSPSSQKSDLVFGGGGIQGRPHAVFVLFSGRRRWTGRRNRHEVSARCCKNWFFPLCAPCCFLACPQPIPCQRWKVVRYTACAGGGSSWSGCSGLTRSFLAAHGACIQLRAELYQIGLERSASWIMASFATWQFPLMATILSLFTNLSTSALSLITNAYHYERHWRT